VLLQEAWRLYPRIYFDRLDVLIIDEIGKDISGTGFDTNVVGRYHTSYASGGPTITRLPSSTSRIGRTAMQTVGHPGFHNPQGI